MNNKKYFPLIGIILIFVILFSVQYFDEVELKNNKEVTKGKVIKFVRKYQARYGLKYEYFVDGEKYTGQCGITPFECDNGTKICLGEDFDVYYSSKNPANSRIDLGKYEKYKTTVEFVK